MDRSNANADIDRGDIALLARMTGRRARVQEGRRAHDTRLEGRLVAGRSIRSSFGALGMLFCLEVFFFFFFFWSSPHACRVGIVEWQNWSVARNRRFFGVCSLLPRCRTNSCECVAISCSFFILCTTFESFCFLYRLCETEIKRSHLSLHHLHNRSVTSTIQMYCEGGILP
jgi:hypothetical protein